MDVFFLRGSGCQSAVITLLALRPFVVGEARRQDGRTLSVFLTPEFFQVRSRAQGGEANPAE